MVGHQFNLALIPHEMQGSVVEQRAVDGYINATAMCKVAGKLFADYSRLQSTKEFLEALSTDMGNPISELIQGVRGGDGAQGSWVHPDVAIHLAQWLSPKFAVQVSKWVREWMSGGHTGGTKIPYHLQRYMANRSQIPYTHFSVLNELIFNLIAPLEEQGYTLPDNMVPDISQGKMFAKWMRETKNIDTDTLPTYMHTYADGRSFPAKLYPIRWLGDFRDHFNKVWLPTRAMDYFKGKDQKALPYLDKILAPALISRPSAPALPSPVKRIT